MHIPALTTEQMIEVDRLMIEDYGISLLRMMENAGRNLAELALRMLKDSGAGKSVVVLCGAGNNGGGGMVAARHLYNRGADVHLMRVGGSPLKEIPAQQWQILSKMGLRNEPDFNLNDADLIIDAIIGYGLQGKPRPNVANVIDQINASGTPVLSLDAPSGLNTSLGATSKPTVYARSTLTLALPKVGLLTESAKEAVGDLYLADISVPPTLYKNLGLDIEPLFYEDTIIKTGE
ncbi:MAG: NAD(P)H-hydrate epimerase [Anaerolineae bacterium]|jgi:NAD(P)H-hydrate epimerase|nr:NAD(P)H-hydrate epimerase [Anaerolineae bacterium]MBT7073303.1 NAD(P)H-hydrate epimerase [Anaerolineae bacterium]